MKKLRFIMLAFLFIAPLFMGTGCQVVKDMFGMGAPEDEEAIQVPPNVNVTEDPSMPDKDWTEPGEGVGERPGEWKKLAFKLPVIHFSYDKFTLGARERNILDQVAEYMTKNPGLGIIVEGNCDDRGSNEYNRALGERRALAVKDYLVSKGISEDRIQTISYGEERPAVKGAGESVWTKNRRAELVLAKMK